MSAYGLNFLVAGSRDFPSFAAAKPQVEVAPVVDAAEEHVFSFTPEAIVPAVKTDEFVQCLAHFEAVFAACPEYIDLFPYPGLNDDTGGYESLRIALQTSYQLPTIKLEVGGMLKAIDTNGVKLLVIGTRVGPVVVYESSDHPCCFHAVGPRILHELRILSYTCIDSTAELHRVVGTPFDPEMFPADKDNIGFAIDQLFASADRFQ